MYSCFSNIAIFPLPPSFLSLISCRNCTHECIIIKSILNVVYPIDNQVYNNIMQNVMLDFAFTLMVVITQSCTFICMFCGKRVDTKNY